MSEQALISTNVAAAVRALTTSKEAVASAKAAFWDAWVGACGDSEVEQFNAVLGQLQAQPSNAKGPIQQASARLCWVATVLVHSCARPALQAYADAYEKYRLAGIKHGTALAQQQAAKTQAAAGGGNRTLAALPVSSCAVAEDLC